MAWVDPVDLRYSVNMAYWMWPWCQSIHIVWCYFFSVTVTLHDCIHTATSTSDVIITAAKIDKRAVWTISCNDKVKYDFMMKQWFTSYPISLTCYESTQKNHGFSMTLQLILSNLEYFRGVDETTAKFKYRNRWCDWVSNFYGTIYINI